MDFGQGKAIKLIFQDTDRAVTKSGILKEMDSDFIIFTNSVTGMIEIIPVLRVLRMEVLK